MRIHFSILSNCNWFLIRFLVLFNFLDMHMQGSGGRPGFGRGGGSYGAGPAGGSGSFE